MWRCFLKTVALLVALAAAAVPAAAADRLSVVATVFPLLDFARNVVGDEGEVSSLLPPGAETHTWEPRPSDVARIGRSQVFLYQGPSVEPWAEGILSSLGEKGRPLVLSAAPMVPYDEFHPALRFEPHFWLDLEKASAVVQAIAEALSSAFPDPAPAFRRNAQAYRSLLTDLDARYIATLSSCRHRTIVFGGHAVFGHLAARYELEQVALYGASPDSEPSPRVVAGVVQAVRSRGLTTVFFEEMVNPRLAEVVAAETGASTRPLFPADNLTAAQAKAGATFLSLMEANLDSLAKGLSCE